MNTRLLQLSTKKIVIFIEKYLRDYENSHIFVMKDDEEWRNGVMAQRHNGKALSPEP
jgi:hypothetical protein